MRKLALIVFIIIVCIVSNAMTPSHPFSTTFPATENPISQSGVWISGHAAGNGCPVNTPAFCFGDVQTRPGQAFGTIQGPTGCTGQRGQNCNDSTAVLAGSWNRVQTAEAIIYTNGTLNTSDFDEVELRLLTTISANSITGYEITCSVSGDNYIGMARWDGPTGSFQTFPTVQHSCKNGDDFKATVDASGNFTVYLNGTVVFTLHDTTYTSGAPGIGFSGNGTLTDYGIKRFTATDSSSTPQPPQPPSNLRITSVQ